MIVSRRQETSEDEAFLLRLIRERTVQELPLNHLPPDMQEQIVRMQVLLRLQSIRGQSGPSSEIIVAGGQPAGWICTHATETELRLIEILILDQYRGKGIGSAVITDLIAAADRIQKPLRLGVYVANTDALRFYERLGFRRIGGTEVQHQMEGPDRVSP